MTPEELAAMAESLKDVVEGVPEDSPIYTLAKGSHMVGWANAVKYHLVAIDCHDDLVAALEVMAGLCVIKYGNLDPDVWAEILKARAILNKARLTT